MNTRELEYILEIAKEKSISKAAEKLYVTQPTLSLFLTRLENQLGIPLFSRTAKGLLPTYAGERYILMCQKVLKEYRDFELELCDISTLHMGRLKVGTSAHIGSYVLPQVIPLFNQAYPNIEVTISEGSSQVLERMINGCELDVALMHLPFKDIEANYTEIAKEPYVMAFAREHPLAGKLHRIRGKKYPFIDPREAAGEKFVLSFPYQRVRQISNRILQNAGITPNIILTTSSVQTALRFAGVGLGVTFLPESYIQLFRCTHKPVFCYMEDRFEAYWTFVMVYPKDAALSGPAKAFIQMAKATYR